MKSILIVLFLCIASISFSQKKNTTKKLGTQLAIRVGTGIDKTFYTEYGLSLYEHPDLNRSPDSVGSWHYAVYSTFVNRLKKDENRPVYGLKFGAECSNLLLAEAIELTTYWNNPNSKTDIIITPKFGLSFLGWINLFYGYNLYVQTKEKPFKNIIGRHQFSVSSNLNLSMLPKRKKHIP